MSRVGGAYQNVQQMQGLLKSFDKNGDGKITIEDMQLILQGLGLGSVSAGESLMQASSSAKIMCESI